MHVFFIVAAAMAVIAAATVAAPLLRDRRNRVIGAVAALVVVGAAAGFYRLWSTWDWNAPMQTRAEAPEIAAMVAKLESRLREQPNDLQGWLMLGRSYEALQRLDDARKIFAQRRLAAREHEHAQFAALAGDDSLHCVHDVFEGGPLGFGHRGARRLRRGIAGGAAVVAAVGNVE